MMEKIMKAFVVARHLAQLIELVEEIDIQCIINDIVIDVIDNADANCIIIRIGGGKIIESRCGSFSGINFDVEKLYEDLCSILVQYCC
jgi:hypothetical protein